MARMQDVDISPVPLERLVALLTPERAGRLATAAQLAREVLGEHTMWNVNATAQGGGVAEMLQTLLAYARGAQVDARWLVLDGDPEFFIITKRVHNFLHGDPGDGGDLGDAEHAHYRRVLAANLATMAGRVRPGDIVLLHDPQTAGLVEGLLDTGAHVVWRSHIGRDDPHPLSDAGWEFLRRYAQRAQGFIFTRRQYAPQWVPSERLWMIPPSIDPFATKNVAFGPMQVQAILRRVGVIGHDGSAPAVPFTRRDGSAGTVRHHTSLVVAGGPLPFDARFVLQVSRWDKLKDMHGVLRGFAEHLDPPDDVHLVLAGPDVSGVTDDPEGAATLAYCVALWRTLPPAKQARVHLVCVPMDDGDENAVIVNALQRRASVVVQKSLVEGFGLTVTEAMWKWRPVVASAVGGIVDQIADGREGLLLRDPTDLPAFAAALRRVLHDEGLAERLGLAARQRAQDAFLGDRHLIQYADLFAALER